MAALDTLGYCYDIPHTSCSVLFVLLASLSWLRAYNVLPFLWEWFEVGKNYLIGRNSQNNNTVDRRFCVCFAVIFFFVFISSAADLATATAVCRLNVYLSKMALNLIAHVNAISRTEKRIVMQSDNTQNRFIRYCVHASIIDANKTEYEESSTSF